MVTVSGLSGLTKAYRSVLSAAGSLLINGASRWLEALTLPEGAPNTASPTTSDRAAATLTILASFITTLSPLVDLALSRRGEACLAPTTTYLLRRLTRPDAGARMSAGLDLFCTPVQTQQDRGRGRLVGLPLPILISAANHLLGRFPSEFTAAIDEHTGQTRAHGGETGRGGFTPGRGRGRL